jgi:hypothetical protein
MHILSPLYFARIVLCGKSSSSARLFAVIVGFLVVESCGNFVATVEFSFGVVVVICGVVGGAEPVLIVYTRVAAVIVMAVG